MFNIVRLAAACCLEHGCEKTHNAYFKQRLREGSISAEPLGFASIQGDGGIANVMQKMTAWFRSVTLPEQSDVVVGLDQVRIGLVSYDQLTQADAAIVEQLTQLHYCGRRLGCRCAIQPTA